MSQGVDEQFGLLGFWRGEERRRSQGGRDPRQLVLETEGERARCVREQDSAGGGTLGSKCGCLSLQRTGQA